MNPYAQPVLLLLHVAAAFAQSLTTMPTSTSITATSGSSSITISSTVPATTTGTALTGLSGDAFYGGWVGQGMSPAAASYYLAEEYGKLTAGANEANADFLLASMLDRALPPSAYELLDDLHRLSVQRYFVSALPTSLLSYESSFLSVWYSYQGITLDSQQSSLYNGMANQEVFNPTTSQTTSSSNAAAESRGPIPNGAIACFLFGVLGYSEL